MWAARESTHGYSDFVPEDELVAAFPGATVDELGFAIAELAKDDFVNTTAYIAKRLPRITTNANLYFTFDPHVLQTDPAVDAAALVDLILKKKDFVGAAALHEECGWPLRRFNPAFAYLLTQIDDQRVSKTNVPDYPAYGFLLMDSDRVDLHRFASRMRG